jgi:hypothetical protein
VNVLSYARQEATALPPVHRLLHARQVCFALKALQVFQAVQVVQEVEVAHFLYKESLDLV